MARGHAQRGGKLARSIPNSQLAQSPIDTGPSADGIPAIVVTASAINNAASQQSLSYNTIQGGPGNNVWVVQWQLSMPSKVGGWIVQRAATTGPSSTYWESWYVLPGSQVTLYASAGDPEDDTFQGFASMNASASFYEGLALPPSFQPGNVPYAGILPSTTVNPNLSGGTTPVVRTWP
jgi:hypothetical protein